MLTQLFYIHALSPLHIGIGQGEGVVDLPIYRAAATNLPIVPGSSIRGAMREAVTYKEEMGSIHRVSDDIFGPERIENGQGGYAGALSMGDANILAMPFRSFKGVFVWASCPFILNRYRRDLDTLDQKNLPPHLNNQRTARIPNTSYNEINNKVIVEELDILAEKCTEADLWSDFICSVVFGETDKASFANRFVILSDDDFCFLSETATEKRTRIKIDNRTGIVKNGALWIEENLPAESVLWCLMAMGPSRKIKSTTPTASDLMHQLCCVDKLHLGAHASVGKGLVRLIHTHVTAEA